jgi:hypothetical protein
MRNALIAVGLCVALAACDKTADAPPSADTQKPAGSTGAPSEAAATPAAERPREVAPVAPEMRGAATPETKAAAAPAPEYREVIVPAGTVLPLDLKTTVGSDTSHVEDPVRATLRRAITIDGLQALPAGTAVTGHVTEAARSARVKGRGRIAFRFNQIDLPGDGGRMAIQTGTVARVAPATKKQDAAKIGAGAAGGAIVGGLMGGGDGAAKGAAIGGGAGTAVVLSTRGKEVRLGEGADLSVKLTAPLSVRVRLR